MTGQTQDRVWLITGCSSGFGREIVLAAVAAGDRVMATARRPEVLQDLADLGKGQVSTYALDVTDPNSVQAAVEATMALFGRIDVLVNNAGFLMMGAVEELTTEQLREQMEVLFFGAAQTTKAVLPSMRERGSGTIVQMSSMGGQTSFHAFGAYHAGKFALEGLSQTLAGEVAPFGVRVVMVEPGAFRTRINSSKSEATVIDAYSGTAGAFRAYVNAMQGSEEGDPAKAAAAIVTAVDSDNPPLRLALGGDAVDGLRAELESRLADLDAWEGLSRSTAVS
ncbi:oxidoreductase [Micromonospora parathelypteridis]|uniref:NAD(P)-dependent dehydrogenase (Short-subunit alcohol dehydrogenase family) n=1 Tax=Micromonospora parathelypteridis TaxID=1839617 RepID=A0A840VRT3_9ACTN|nr:oxidoreductase [Micromonospora parathelypteridis]MBB5479923.1 NAD(P)-dependent dehydrogenase (short-subunit alcohol dehydrogenase family) [Micromonospora parathelypteridis]GGO25879.1 short-chain dehydrogenase/reductase [Micromonospora parathelypteridis]